MGKRIENARDYVRKSSNDENFEENYLGTEDNLRASRQATRKTIKHY